MIDIKEYATLQEALTLLRQDHEYTAVRHVLKAGEKIEDHFHPSANEILIAPAGGFSVRIDCSRHYVVGNPGFVAITFSKGTLHGLKAEKDLSYLVLRNALDETIWLADLMRKRESVSPIENEGETIRDLYNAGNLSIAYVRAIGTVNEHWHVRTTEIYCGIAGRGEVVVDGKRHSIGQGDTLALPPNTKHYLKRTHDPFEIIAISHPGYDPADVFFT